MTKTHFWALRTGRDPIWNFFFRILNLITNAFQRGITRPWESTQDKTVPWPYDYYYIDIFLFFYKGYRVEYSAASDAYTHCPEGFNEFFNQRRRWVPSTIANIFDLLMNYKVTVAINDNISLPYVGYQTMLMVSSATYWIL